MTYRISGIQSIQKPTQEEINMCKTLPGVTVRVRANVKDNVVVGMELLSISPTAQNHDATPSMKHIDAEYQPEFGA